MHEDFVTVEELRSKRDAKAKPHLEQYAPVWIVDERVLLEEEAIQFNVLFLHSTAGDNYSPSWVSRRYRYDAFNDTLYHKGQNRVDEEEALEFTETEPYITTTAADVPNAYGG